MKTALHPKKRKIVFDGAQSKKNNPLYEAVESSAWHVNVYPICEHFRCWKEGFRGSWEDRFT